MKPEAHAFPTISATFHLTHACNLRCDYCYTGEKFGIGMTAATARDAVTFAHQLACEARAQHLEIVFFGGEPLLKHDLLCSIVDQVRVRAKGMRVSFKMSTNGLLLSPRVIADLAAREVFVSLSIDGDPATQDAQRPDPQGRGSAAKLVDVIPRVLAWNPHTAVNCVITPKSAPNADESVKWLFAQGFRYVSTALDWGGNWTRRDLNALGKAYHRLGEWYVSETRRDSRFYLSCFDEKIQSRTRGPLELSERCAMGYRQFSIAPSGRLYPCVQFVKEDDQHEWCIGDVWQGFDDSKRGALLGCAEAPREECGGCALSDRCGSWCACMNYQGTGRLDTASPLVCEHDRLLTPIADRVANQLWKQRHPLFLHKHYNPAFPVLSHIETDVETARLRHTVLATATSAFADHA